MMHISKKLLAFSVASLLLSVSACTTYSNMTANDATRRQMLQQKVGKFHQMTTRGQFDLALESVSPESQADFVNLFQQQKRKENVVEKEIDTVDFSPDVDQATVSVLVRYFKQPNYVVMERKETETWVYSTSEGWQWLKADKVNAEDARPTTLRGSL